MKISYRWLQDFLPITESPAALGARLTSSGLEVEGIEEHDAIPGGLKNVVIGKVLSAVQHPNADRLRVCLVDTGDESPRQIVCGASNVAEGQKVIVALPGAKLFPTAGGEIEIKKSKIRGEESAGMICAEDELGLGESHEGIMVLDTDLPIGTPAGQYFNLESDSIFEIGLTANRGDAASHIGTARDVSALLNRPFRQAGAGEAMRFLPNELLLDKTPKPQPTGAPSFKIEIDRETCLTYTGILIEGIKIAPSPDWLKRRLTSVGLSSINAVVDVTNFFLMHVGQPMHAFDAAKLTGNTIRVGMAPAGQKLTLLDKREITLNGSELAILDDSGPIALAGVMGGMSTAVSDGTTSIFLESACFNPANVRKTAAMHTISTDASFRFARGTDPNQPLPSLLEAAWLITALCGGHISGGICTEEGSFHYQGQSIYLPFDKLNTLVGEVLPEETVTTILERLGFSVKPETQYGHSGFAEGLHVKVPSHRMHDVEGPADLGEEVIRVYGIDNIKMPASLSVRFFDAAPGWQPFELEKRVGSFLSSKGFSEIVTNSLTQPGHQLKTEGEEAVRMLNPLSEEHSEMRLSAIPSGLAAIAWNANRRQRGCSFFEIARTYHHDAEAKFDLPYREREHLMLYYWGLAQEESWQGKAEPVAFHHLYSGLKSLLELLGIDAAPAETPLPEGYSYGITLMARNKAIGFAGMVSPALAKRFDVKGPVFAADLDWALLVQMSKPKRRKMAEPPRFPEVRRDLSLVLDKKISYAQIEQLALKTEKKLLRRLNLFDVFEGPSLGAGKKAYAVSFHLLDEAATLTDTQIDRTMQQLEDALVKGLGAVVRR